MNNDAPPPPGPQLLPRFTQRIQTPPAPERPSRPLPDDPSFRDMVEALLGRPRDMGNWLSTHGQGAMVRFALVALVSLLLFGLVIGGFAKGTQLWAAPLKIAGGSLVAGAICFPSLFIFSTLAGGSFSFRQMRAVLAGVFALAGLLLLGFAPAIWVFAESTDSYGFVGTLGIAAWLAGIFFGVRFLKTAVLAAGGSTSFPVTLWGFVLALVTLQMTTSLRPILGSSPQFFTSEKKFFLQHWADWIGESQAQPTHEIHE
jgi:hypothetical protein